MDRPYGEQISDLLENSLFVSDHDHNKCDGVCRKDDEPRNEEAEHKIVKRLKVGVHIFHPYRSENKNAEYGDNGGK